MIVSAFDISLLLYSVSSAIYTGIVLLGCRAYRAHPAGAEPDPGVALGLVIPAFNAAPFQQCMRQTIAACQQFGSAVAVVDDGSATPLALPACAGWGKPDITLLRHNRNRGKAAALSTGIASFESEIIATVDADTVLLESDLRRALRPFFDARLGAVALSLSVAPGGTVERIQALEYRYVLNFERQALSRFGFVSTVPGAASLWRRSAIEEIGGFSGRTMSEDTDATIGLSSAGWRIAVCPEAKAVTRGPEAWITLLRQRRRWIWGNAHVAVLRGTELTQQGKLCWPSLLFATLTAWHLCAYLLVSSGVVAVLLGRYSTTAIASTAFLLLLSLLRASFAIAGEGVSAKALPAVLVSAAVMQAVNVAAFWSGLATGTAWSHRWT